MNAKLEPSDLEEIKLIIKGRESGIYTVAELAGEEFWQTIADPTTYGRLFKQSVLEGDVPNVEWHDRASDNSQLYKVVP